MKINRVVAEVNYEIKDLTHKEGMVLRTLLNLSELGVEKKLQNDELYWDDKMTLVEAKKIGIELVNKIITAVDGE